MSKLLSLSLILTFLISACVQQSETYPQQLIGVNDACVQFNDTGVFSSSVSCPYPYAVNPKINNQTFFISQYCAISESIDKSRIPFVYLKDSFLNTLDTSNLELVYCEVVTEAAPKVYRYIRKNNQITHLFLASPSPCIDYSVYILSRKANTFSDFVKPEYLNNTLSNTLNILSGYDPAINNAHYLSITIRENDIMIHEKGYTCP